MKTVYSNPRRSNPLGFTLVELLVAMTVIGILVGMLAFAIQRVLGRSKEFAIQVEMSQLESALQKFQTEYGFYPPSFKEMEKREAQGTSEDAANLLMTYINRIAPNNIEGSGVYPNRPVDIWWAQVGSKRRDMDPADPNNTGSELVFWLSGLARDKQRPLTTGPLGNIVPNVAHSFISGGDDIPRQTFFDFKQSQIELIPDPVAPALFPWAQYLQPAGRDVRYLYLDASNYLPTEPMNSMSTDGAYVKPGVMMNDIVAAQNNPMLFNQIYPNPDSFQLIAFGVDGLPGVVQNPNDYSLVGPAGADNMVNFGPDGPGRLENLILEEN